MENILYLLSDYKLLAIIAGFIIIGIETFIPVLPLVAIIVANVFVLGMWTGFFVSWIGSSVASILLYYLCSRFSQIKVLREYKEKENTKKIIKWIKRQGFNSIFISYVCPFIPDFLITIASGFTQLDFKSYASGMIFGKCIMFLLISYVGEDISTFFQNPIKIAIFTLIISISWLIGKNINNKIHNIDKKNKL